MKMLFLLFKEFIEVIYDLLPLDIENLLEGNFPENCVGCMWESILLFFGGS